MTLANYNVYLTCPVAGQIMTLNALTNGYYSSPASTYGNPPAVAQYVNFPCTNVKIIQTAGLLEAILDDETGTYTYISFNYEFSFNLPDGSLLTFGFTVKTTAWDLTYSVELTPSVPTVSSGSLFAVSYDPDYQTSLNLTLELVN